MILKLKYTTQKFGYIYIPDCKPSCILKVSLSAPAPSPAANAIQEFKSNWCHDFNVRMYARMAI